MVTRARQPGGPHLPARSPASTWSARCWPRRSLGPVGGRSSSTATTSGWPTTAGSPSWPGCRPSWVVPLPGGLSPRQAATIGTAGFTAALSLHRLERPRSAPRRRAGPGHRGLRRGGQHGRVAAGVAWVRGGGQHRQGRRGRTTSPGSGPPEVIGRDDLVERTGPHPGPRAVGRCRGLRRRAHAGRRAPDPALRRRRGGQRADRGDALETSSIPSSCATSR